MMSRILVTGASGVVGGSVLPFLPSSSRVYLLLRAKDAEHLEKRRQEILNFYGILDPDQRSQFVAVRGDITQENLGLADDDIKQVFEGLTQIIHCAASVNLEMTAEEAAAHSVKPVQIVLRMQEKFSTAHRRIKVDYVSTVGVNGRRQEPLLERPITELRGFHNTYESSKAEAERYIYEAMVAGWPITIHRPSMVVGNSHDGKILHFQIFYLIVTFLTGILSSRLLPKLDSLFLDTVPSDYVGRVIAWSSQSEKSHGRIYHLCTGPENSINLEKLRLLICEQMKSLGLKPPRTWQIPLDLFIWAMSMAKKMTSDEKLKHRLDQLPMFLKYARIRQKFSSAESQADLMKVGIKLPLPEEYLPKVLHYFLQEKKHRF